MCNLNAYGTLAQAKPMEGFDNIFIIQLVYVALYSAITLFGVALLKSSHGKAGLGTCVACRWGVQMCSKCTPFSSSHARSRLNHTTLSLPLLTQD